MSEEQVSITEGMVMTACARALARASACKQVPCERGKMKKTVLSIVPRRMGLSCAMWGLD
jgi:hypothetical protein